MPSPYPKSPKFSSIVLGVSFFEINFEKNKLININFKSEYIFQCAATLIAAGIDPTQTILYQQSHVRSNTSNIITLGKA